MHKLENALVVMEKFLVVLGHSPQFFNDVYSIVVSIGAFTQPLKLRLCRAFGDNHYEIILQTFSLIP
jgi:hypothetical protein